MGEPQTLTQRVSKAVWEIIRRELPMDSPFCEAQQPSQLDINEESLRSLQDMTLLSGYVGNCVSASTR